MKKGIKFGRKKIPIDENFKAVYMKWKQGNITAVKAMELVAMKNNTFYRRVKEYESIWEYFKNSLDNLLIPPFRGGWAKTPI